MATKLTQQLTQQLNQLASVSADASGKNQKLWQQFVSSLENVTQITEQQARLLDTIAVISNAAGSITELSKLLNMAVTVIRQNFELGRVDIFLLDRTDQWLELGASTADESAQGVRLKVNDKNSRVSQVIREEQARRANGGPDARSQPVVPRQPQGESAEIAVPLVSRSQLIGALSLYAARPRTFGNDSLALFQTLANQLANTIHNVLLFTGADQQLEQLITLHSINLQIGNAPTLAQMLDDVAKLSTKLVNAHSSVVRLIDEAAQQFKIQALFNPPQGLAPGHTEPLNAPLSGHVLKTAEAVLINNWASHPLADRYPQKSGGKTEIQALLAVPIHLQSKIIGIIEVHNRANPQAFFEKDVYTLSLLAAQAAVSIENTRLLTQAENSRRFLKTIIEHIPDPIFIKDKNHIWVEMNPANANVIGRPNKELIGKTDSMYFPEELANEFYRRDDEVFATNQIFEYEDKTVWGDGKEHIAYTRLIPVPDANGQPEYLLGISNDVTERKAHEAERERFLAETSALYNGSRTIASSLSERQILAALLWQIRLQNPCEISAYRIQTVQNEPIWAELRAAWHKNNQPTYQVGKKIFLPDSPHARLFTSDDAMFIDDIATDERLSAAERDEFGPSGAKSAAVLPIRFIGQKVGVVVVYFTAPYHFSDVTQRFWLAMVDQAGMALSNRQLIQEAAYRAIQMETAAEVARAASSLLKLDELLNSAVALIRDRFELYYAGAFLVDDSGEWAVLRAGTGPEGKVQLKNNHRLKIGGESMIGWSIANRQPRIALDVGKEAVHFQNPHLPNTRSEMALPLIYHNRAIGALTIQSAEQAAFSREDVIFLQTMADQLANAIQNARLFEQAQQELAERKRIEKELRASETKYRQLIENANSIIIRINTAGEITFINEFAQKFFGYTQEEALGRPMLETIIPKIDSQGNDMTRLAENIVNLPDEYTNFESENMRHDNTRVWVSWATRAIRDDNGELVEILCVGNDVTERQHAEQEILRRNEELAAVNRMAVAITSAADPRERFRNVIHEMLDMFEARRGGIALLNPEQTELTLVADVTADGSTPSEGYVIPIDGNPSSKRAIETGKSVVVNNPQTSPLTKPIHKMLRETGVESLMIVPLITRGRVIGTLGIDHGEPGRRFVPSEVQLAETIAGQLAGAIENARLLEQTRTALNEREIAQHKLAARERYLAAELTIQNRLLASKEQSPPYNDILATLGQVSGASRVSVFENYHTGQDELISSQVAEWCNEGISPKINTPDLQNLPLSETFPDWVQLLSAGQMVAGCTTDFPAVEQAFLELHNIRATLILPLIVGGEFFGFISFDNCVTDQPWDSSEQGLLSSSAAAVSLWHERRQAEESLLQALQRTESLYRIGNAMATTTGLRSTFETILAEYLRLLNIKPASGSIILFEHKKGYSKVHALLVNGTPVESNLVIPASQDFVGQYLIENPTPLVIENVYLHSLTKDSPTFWQHHEDVQSLLFLPLIIGGDVTGTLTVGIAEKGYQFLPSNIEIGQVVADQLAIWLENRQLLAEAQYRTERLQTAAEVSRAASSILDTDELINTSVNAIRDSFDFYYVGLFLVDETREWAVLRAGTGRAGRIQLARHHKLKIGGESMIGWCVANGQARIALDVGAEAVHFRNPILPDTHSEMALPLISRDQVLGALTVQSVERNAFSNEDITLLQTMADQLANAIVNARLFESAAQARQQAEERLRETEALQKLSHNLATTLDVDEILDVFFKSSVAEIGFEYIIFSLVDEKQQRVRAIGGIGVTENQVAKSNRRMDSNDIMADIVRTGKTEIITGWDERFDRELFDAEGHADWMRLFAPVTLRHKNIGLVEAGFNQSKQATITDAQIRLLHAFINQTALALDNAQRYQESRRAARREAMIKEITTRVRASTNLDTILQTTVRELGSAISSKRAYIHLSPPKKTNGKAAGGTGNPRIPPPPVTNGGSEDE
ncbi:MAG: GAF domain-containing protein [Chloroflexi bacterium]|nr:MAG: GAF domain-containing protein [Chloroflexota bacterium]